MVLGALWFESQNQAINLKAVKTKEKATLSYCYRPAEYYDAMDHKLVFYQFRFTVFLLFSRVYREHRQPINELFTRPYDQHLSTCENLSTRYFQIPLILSKLILQSIVLIVSLFVP